jgi:hypothetical protein
MTEYIDIKCITFDRTTLPLIVISLIIISIKKKKEGNLTNFILNHK